MPRIFRFNLSQPKTCPRCLKETEKIFVLAESHPKATRNLGKGYFLCGECLADILAESRFLVRSSKRIKFRELINKA